MEMPQGYINYIMNLSLRRMNQLHIISTSAVHAVLTHLHTWSLALPKRSLGWSKCRSHWLQPRTNAKRSVHGHSSKPHAATSDLWSASGAVLVVRLRKEHPPCLHFHTRPAWWSCSHMSTVTIVSTWFMIMNKVDTWSNDSIMTCEVKP
jgi:hypothetical protein